jgi:hypothetical protein
MANNIISVPVFASCVNKNLSVNLHMRNICADLTSQVPDLTKQGSKVVFPSFVRVAKMDRITTKGTAIVPADLDQSSIEEDVLQTGGAVRVYDKDAATIGADTINSMSMQIADAMNVDIDSALSAKMLEKATHKSASASATAITYTELLDALQLFGDHQDAELYVNGGICINSRLIPSFYEMDAFVDAQKTFQASGNGVIKGGLIGYLNGYVPVYVTNNGTWDDTAKECITYITHANSVGYAMQSAQIEQEREAKLLATDIVGSMLYSTAVVDADGLVVCRKTIA